MIKSALSCATALAALAGAAAVISPGAHADAAAAATAGYGFNANAFGSQVTAQAGNADVTSGRSAYAVISCTQRAQSQTDSAAGVSIPAVSTTLGNVTDTVTSVHASGSDAWSDTAHGEISGVSAAGGAVKATAVTTDAAASLGGHGGPTASGSVKLSGLTVAGKSVGQSPKPNTKMTVAGVGTVELNAQKTVKNTGRALENIDAIVITTTAGNTLGVPAGTVITIGHVLATVGGPIVGLVSGRSFGTSATSGSTVVSSPSFLAYVNCTGSGGAVTTNQGAGGTVAGVQTGAVTDTATSTVTATDASAQTTSKVAGASIAGVLTISSLSSSAQASRSAGGDLTSSGSVSIGKVTVGGVTVKLPSKIPANYTVSVPGGVSLTLNKQTIGQLGLQVDAAVITTADGTTVTIASSSAYA